MQLQNYFRILLRRGWIMVLLALMTAAAAFAFSTIQLQRAPVYEATVRVLVVAARPDFGQAQAARQLLRDYATYLDSSLRAEEVIDELQLDMTPQQLMGEVNIAADDSRTVITVEAQSSSPEQAAAIAQNWAQLLVEWRNVENAEIRREDHIEAQILDNPQIALAEPRRMINTAAGGIAGFLVGLAIVFILEYLESGIIRSSEDVDRFLEMPVLGAIPQSD
jgi:capsular polysaccharide biosynthesis protein